MPRPVDNPPNPWHTTHVEYLGEPPPARLEVFEERARSIITENDSPDVGFRFGVNPYRGCVHACAYCIAGSTPILMADGMTKPIERLRVGDTIWGTEMRGRYRRYVRTEVLAHWATVKPAWRVRLRDGTELIASGDHRFLTAQRGWKYVSGAERGPACRPHLTCNNQLMGTGRFASPPAQDAEYRRGYLCGMIRGDGLFGFYACPRSRGGGGRQYQFRLALIDLEAIARSRTYLFEFGVATQEFEFAQASSDRRAVRAIRTQARSLVERVDDLIAWPVCASDSWCKGFLAGVFDAEGSYRRGILRVSNADPSITDRTVECLTRLSFDPIVEHRARPPGANGASRDMHDVRVRGGLREHLRFFHTVAPAITRKRDIGGQAMKLVDRARLEVVAIEPLGVDLPMYDITTGTGDFIANGVVSHNCFARPSHQYLGFGAGTDFDRKIVVKVNAPELLRKEFDRKSWQGDALAFSGNTDCYQALEGSYELTKRCLEVCLEYRNPVAIITKGALIRRDLPLIAQLAREASVHVYVSVAFASDEDSRKLEPWTSSPTQRFETIRALTDAGVRVGVALAPVIPGLNDTAIPEILARAREAGATSAFMTLIRLPREVLPVFDERLGEAFPTRADKVRNAIREMRGGRANNSAFGERMRGHGPRWEAISALFDATRRKLGYETTAYRGKDAEGEGSEETAAPATTFRRPTRQGSLFDK